MEWHDRALVLAARKHGESSSIVSLLTEDRGRHLGLVRGGQSRRRQGLLQPGNLVMAAWRARLSEHLGTYSIEPDHDYAAATLDDPLRLKALASAMALLDATLAEREAHPDLFAATLHLLKALESPGNGGASGPLAWAGAYARWELALLAELGFGLDLTACAVTGGKDDLIYVSPRSGRAVSAAAGHEWREKLLPLPAFLTADGTPDTGEIAAGLRLTGYFFDRHHFAAGGARMPAARSRLVEAFRE